MVAGAAVLLATLAAVNMPVPLQVNLVLHAGRAGHVPLKGTLHLVPVGGQGFAVAKANDVSCRPVCNLESDGSVVLRSREAHHSTGTPYPCRGFS